VITVSGERSLEPLAISVCLMLLLDIKDVVTCIILGYC